MTTYYVDGAVGSDANAGTSEGAGNAWATIDKAMNTVIAGDIVYVKASATYAEIATIDTSAVYNNHITFEGYTSTPGDNGKATMDGTTWCLTYSVVGGSNIYYVFKNFIFTGTSSSCVGLAGVDYCGWVNCDFQNGGAFGASVGDYHVFVNCTATGNGNTGFDCDLGPNFIGCIAATNAGEGFLGTSGGIAYKCVNYGQSADHLVYMPGNSHIIACTLDGENSLNGIATGHTDPLIVDNIVYDCNLALNTGTPNCLGTICYNLLNSNTTDYETGLDYSVNGLGDVSGAPAFTDEAGDDYTLSEASPAIGAGLTPGGIT